jgi:hypothetical protein
VTATYGEIMDAAGAWVLVGIALGLLVTIGLGVLVFVRRRNMGATAPDDMTGDQWLTLGFVFMGAGIALVAAIGVQMVFMVAIGVVYLAIGLRMKRQEPK